MSRTERLENVTSARLPSQALTPRTPHSRSGRAEEGYTEIELQEIDQEEIEQYRLHSQQEIPLLVSDNSFPPSGWRNRGDDYNGNKKFQGLTLSLVISRIPIVIGVLVILFLLAMIWGAVSDPEGAKDLAENPGPDDSLVDLTKFISYENYTSFPLKGAEYRRECQKILGGFMLMGDYWDPPMHGFTDVPHLFDSIFDGSEGQGKICSRTITYQLDGSVGLLADLALLSQAAALARERNRTFLVDDTYWNRGKWTDYFHDVRVKQVGPEPDCIPPPVNELVACPRTARHWIVSARTAKFHFGEGFQNHYDDSYARGLNRLKPIFEFSRASLAGTILPNEEMATLIRRARTEMTEKLRSAAQHRVSVHQADDNHHAPSYIGVHLRRGDQHASSWEYHNGYVPIAQYAKAISETWARLLPSVPEPMVVYIASDSPSARQDLVKTLPANTQILSLSLSGDMQLKALESPMEYVQAEFAQMPEEDRKKATRGVIVDFAMVSGMWDQGQLEAPEATVCTIKSSICRLSAVGLGWDQAFGNVDDLGNIDKVAQRWVEIDQAARIIPVWEAYQLFP